MCVQEAVILNRVVKLGGDELGRKIMADLGWFKDVKLKPEVNSVDLALVNLSFEPASDNDFGVDGAFNVLGRKVIADLGWFENMELKPEVNLVDLALVSLLFDPASDNDFEVDDASNVLGRKAIFDFGCLAKGKIGSEVDGFNDNCKEFDFISIFTRI